MKLVPNAINQTVARQGLLASKNAPTVLFATGVAGMLGSTVLACRATLKMDEVVQKTKADLDTAKSVKMTASKERETTPVTGVGGEKVYTEEDDQVVYTETDYRKDCAIIYSRAFVSTAKLYGPAILLGSASIACLTKSHDILSKRNAALTAAYIAVDEAFTAYRERVVEKYGEEQDREFRYGYTEVEVVDETGKMYKDKQPSEFPSMYARYFDRYSKRWEHEPDYNLVFLRCQEKYANDMLRTRGHIFLNEVYDMLGLDRTTPGSVVGWVRSDSEGDSYIDFGIFKDSSRSTELKNNVWNGRNEAILLDFNVDGVIYDKIGNNKEKV